LNLDFSSEAVGSGRPLFTNKQPAPSSLAWCFS
jgi:hypothetical protein